MSMSKPMFRVVKVTVKTGCDLCQEVVKANLSASKAKALRDRLENQNVMGDFDPHSLVSFLIQPAA